MEYLAFFSTAFVVGLSGALMPGPLTTVSFTESARRGWHASPIVVTGHGLAELVMVIALAVGLSRLLSQTLVVGAIGVLGGAFLVWMGVGMVRGVLDGSLRLGLSEASSTTGIVPGNSGAVAVGRRTGLLGTPLVITGILISVSNPYWLMWWATVGAEFVTRSLQLGLLGIVAFFFGHILSDYSWNGLLGVIAHSGRKVLNDRIYGGIIAVCGAFVGLLGMYFIYSGIGHWLA
ncbi:MAG: LysE family translocator [Bacteroidetes bacterium]|nr:LysE family translocator [Bacteroidota bacterium]